MVSMSMATAATAAGPGWSLLISSSSSHRFVYCVNCHHNHFLSLNRPNSTLLFNFQQKPHKPNHHKLPLRPLNIPKAADSTQPSTSADKSLVSDDEFSIAKVLGLHFSHAQKLRENCATPILKQVRNDVTRYRYGDEQHLDEALKRIFQYGQGGGIPRRSAPVLQMIREEVTEDGKYSLILVFEAKALQLSDFEQRQAKFASFFGPGITAEVVKGDKDLYEVQLISNTIL